MKAQSSYIPKKITRAWFEVDASSSTVGRVASKIANLLRGKHKRDFTPHLDLGDFVVVINADKLKLTGRKIEQKQYFHYSGYPGGLRTKQLKDMIVTQPEEVLRRAIFNMIDDIRLRRPMMRRLHLIKGTTHTFKIDKKA